MEIWRRWEFLIHLNTLPITVQPHDKQTSSYASLDIFILVEIPELDLLTISEAIARYLVLC